MDSKALDETIVYYNNNFIVSLESFVRLGFLKFYTFKIVLAIIQNLKVFLRVQKGALLQGLNIDGAGLAIIIYDQHQVPVGLHEHFLVVRLALNGGSRGDELGHFAKDRMIRSEIAKRHDLDMSLQKSYVFLLLFFIPQPITICDPHFFHLLNRNRLLFHLKQILFIIKPCIFQVKMDFWEHLNLLLQMLCQSRDLTHKSISLRNMHIQATFFDIKQQFTLCNSISVTLSCKLELFFIQSLKTSYIINLHSAFQSIFYRNCDL